MIAVLFEVRPAPGRQQRYLELAAVLRDYGMSDRSEAPQDSRVAHDDA